MSETSSLVCTEYAGLGGIASPQIPAALPRLSFDGKPLAPCAQACPECPKGHRLMWITAEEEGYCDVCAGQIRLDEEILECSHCNWWKCQRCQGTLLPPAGQVLQPERTDGSLLGGLREPTDASLTPTDRAFNPAGRQAMGYFREPTGHCREPTECSLPATEHGAQVLAEHWARSAWREGTGTSLQTDDAPREQTGDSRASSDWGRSPAHGRHTAQREETGMSQFSMHSNVPPLATIQETSVPSHSSRETTERGDVEGHQMALEPPLESQEADISDDEEAASADDGAAPFVAPLPPSRVPWFHWSRLSRQPAVAKKHAAQATENQATSGQEVLHRGSAALRWDTGAGIFQESVLKVDRRFNFLEVHTQGAVTTVRLHLIVGVLSGPDAPELLSKLGVEDERYPVDTAVVVRHGGLGAPLDHEHALVFIGAEDLDQNLLDCVVAAPDRQEAEERSAMALQRWWRRRAEDARSGYFCDMTSQCEGSIMPPPSLSPDEAQSVEALAACYRNRANASCQTEAPGRVYEWSEAPPKRATGPHAFGDAPGNESGDFAADVSRGVGPFLMHSGLRDMFMPHAVAQDPEFESAAKHAGRPSLLDSADALLEQVRSGLQIFGGCATCVVHDRAPAAGNANSRTSMAVFKDPGGPHSPSVDKHEWSPAFPSNAVSSGTPAARSDAADDRAEGQRKQTPREDSHPPTPDSEAQAMRWRMHGGAATEVVSARSPPPPPASWDAAAGGPQGRAGAPAVQVVELTREEMIERAEAEQEARRRAREEAIERERRAREEAVERERQAEEARRKAREEAIERERQVAREALERARREAELDAHQATRDALEKARRQLEQEAHVDAQMRAQRAAREDALREAAAQEEALVRQAAREQAAREAAEREAAARERDAQAASEAAEREAAAREREAAAREAAAWEEARLQAAREVAARESAAKDSAAREGGAALAARSRGEPATPSGPLTAVPVSSDRPSEQHQRAPSTPDRVAPWAEAPLKAQRGLNGGRRWEEDSIASSRASSGQNAHQESWEEWRARQTRPPSSREDRGCAFSPAPECMGRRGMQQCNQQ